MRAFQPDEILKTGQKFCVYKSMLTPNQQKIGNMFFNNNLNMSEIAVELKISRQAVLKSIKSAVITIEKLENALNFSEKSIKILEAVKHDKTLKNKILKILNS